MTDICNPEVKVYSFTAALPGAMFTTHNLSGAAGKVGHVSYAPNKNAMLWEATSPYNCCISFVNGITRGYTSEERIGNKINVLEIRFNIVVAQDDNAAATKHKLIQFAVLNCKSGCTNTINLFDVFDTNINRLPGDICNSIAKDNMSSSYKILHMSRMDTRHSLVDSAYSTYVRLSMNKPVTFGSGADMTMSNIISNNIVLLFQVAAPEDDVENSVVVSASVCYTDI